MESVTTSEMVYPTSPHPLAGEEVPLTIFDRAAGDIFVPILLAYAAPAPSNEAVKEGLLRAVAPYPHLAGRLAVDRQGRRRLHINNEGVLVVEATVSGDLADLIAAGMAAADELYPPLPEESVGAALLQIKLNRCRCGGLVVGVVFHHQVADGHSMSMFFTTWSRAMADNKHFTAVDPTTTTKPFLDRAATAVPRSTSALSSFEHRSIVFEDEIRDHKHPSYAVVPVDRIKNLTARFTAAFVADLKARAAVVGAGGSRCCTTFQCVLAHVWKKVTAARGLAPEQFTRVKVAVNCRARARPPVPADFFGNMVLWAFPKLQVKDLLSSSYARAVDAIRDAVARVDHEYIQSFVDFGTSVEEEELVAVGSAPGTVLCPDLKVDSWLGFQLHEMDLGAGPPCAFLPPDIPTEGLMVFVPSRTECGGVDVFLAIADEHAGAFQKICHSLD